MDYDKITENENNSSDLVNDIQASMDNSSPEEKLPTSLLEYFNYK